MDGHKDGDMFIQTAGVVSTSRDISSERETIAKVVIGAFGAHSNTCTGNLKVSADREGTNIYLTAKMEKTLLLGLCGSAVTEVYGEVTVKNLEVGEYRIQDDNSRELGRFRIKEEGVYTVVVDVDPIVSVFIVSPTDPDDPNTYVVEAIIRIAEIYEPHCHPLPRLILRLTDREEIDDVINVNIECVVPSTDPGCAVVVNPYPYTQDTSFPHYRYGYNTEIYLGVFPTGSYRVVINGKDYLFDVPSGAFSVN